MPDATVTVAPTDRRARIQQDLIIAQGADYSHTWGWGIPTLPLTGAAFTRAVCQVRDSQRPTGALLANLTCLVTDDPAFTGEVLITVQATHAESSAWLWTAGWYQVELDHPALGRVRFAQGAVGVDREVALP